MIGMVVDRLYHDCSWTLLVLDHAHSLTNWVSQVCPNSPTESYFIAGPYCTGRHVGALPAKFHVKGGSTEKAVDK